MSDFRCRSYLKKYLLRKHAYPGQGSYSTVKVLTREFFIYWPKDADLLVCSYVTQATTKSIEDIYCVVIHVRFSFSLLFKDAVSYSDFVTSNKKEESDCNQNQGRCGLGEGHEKLVRIRIILYI